MTNPFDKFKANKEKIAKDIAYQAINKVVIEKASRSEFILSSRNKANDTAFCFLLDCLNRKYRITKEMIVTYFKDHGLEWENTSSKLNATGNMKLDKFLRILKWEPERLAYAESGELLILSK